MTYKQEFITFMVRSGVLTFGDFTTKSGRKTPYFVNTGNYKTGAQAAKLGDYYAACIQENMPDGITALFGPAYKGLPLAVTAAASLYRNYDRDLPYCFNRKEAKDHGEGGSMVGYKPQDGDDVAIIEDVVTAGTAVRESIELFKHVADFSLVEYDKKGKEKEVITFYVTDDKNHLPVRLDLYLNFGSAKAFLRSIEGNRHPLTSIIED